MTSIWSAGLFKVPYKGPSFPIAKNNNNKNRVGRPIYSVVLNNYT